MIDNPYAPTSTRLEDAAAERLPSVPAFYVVSPHKFAMLFLLTGGIYSLYWFYENWRCHRLHSGERVSPALRAIFAIFFVHSLFQRVEGRLLWGGLRTGWGTGIHATCLVLLFLCERILAVLASRGVWVPVSDLLSILVIIPVYALMARAQHYINLACGDPYGEENDHLTVFNYVWMLAGLLLWLLVMIGLLSRIFIA